MPSEFQNNFAGALSALKTRFSEPASYCGPDGAIVTGLTIRIHRHAPHQTDSKATSGQSQTADVYVNQSDMRPARDGRFTVNAVEVWSVETTPFPQNGKWVCTVSRDWDERLMARRAKSNG